MGTEGDKRLSTTALIANKYKKKYIEEAFQGKVMKDLKKNKIWKTLTDQCNSMVKSLMNSFAEFGKASIKAAEEAGEYVLDQIPTIIRTFLGEVFDVHKSFKKVANIVGNIGRGVQAAYRIWRTRNLLDDINDGAPSLIIEGVRNQIKSQGMWKALEGVGGILQEGLNVAVPVVGKVVSTITSILGRIGEVFYHFKDTRKLELIIEDAQNKYESWERKTADNLVVNGNKFYKWYSQAVNDMPIISSYALATPLTGSYYGFLSTVSKTGRWLTQEELASNYDSLRTLKTEAMGFMREHSVKLYSRVSLVAMSIDIAHGIPFDQEKFNDMLQKLIYREPWILNWLERQAHEWKYSKYEDEEDLSDDLSDDCPDGSSVLETGLKITGKPKKVSKKDKLEKKGKKMLKAKSKPPKKSPKKAKESKKSKTSKKTDKKAVSKEKAKPKRIATKTSNKVEKKKKKSSKEGTKAKNKAARGCKLNTNQWGKAWWNRNLL